ncbi:EAL domain-containing protein [Thioalkalivibrio sulfidiphilus]|uniref:EAL domain-containing protein n=1 Tax=Thioalkalivibrio sulfidiphilus TaxID=1033854 RepID=UPI000360E077|nr:EAL domain-containing protein [Thioalkalivibrio sulfidiphilus]
MQSIDIFPWHPSLETGIDAIDAQQRRFVELLNRLAGEIAISPSKATLVQNLDELIDYAVGHFKTEEALWHEHIADESAELAHRDTHRAFLSDLARLRISLEAPDTERVADDLLEYLARWLASHRLTSDLYMTTRVRAREEGLSASEAHARANEQLTGVDRRLINAIQDLSVSRARSTVLLRRERESRHKLDEALKRQQTYREFIIRLAVSFVNLPLERLDSAIEEALAQMSSFFAADRAYVFHYDFTTQTSSNTHEWCAPGVQPMIDELQDLPMTLSPEWMNAHLQGKPMIIPSVSEMPVGPVKELLNSQGVHSLLTIPLMDGDRCLGFVGFDSVQEWQDFGRDEREVLELFANLMVSLTQRKVMSAALRDKTDELALAHNRLMSILDGANAGVYVADMQTHEVLFVNDLTRRLLGNVVGETCWKVIQGKTKGPCDFCTNPRLLDTDGRPTPPVVWEHFNPQLNRWFQLHDQAIPWDDGRYVRLEIALDITDQKVLEQSLRDSEERYRVLFEQSRDALMIVAPPDWRFQAGNRAMIELFGARDLDELLSLTPIDLSPPSQPDGRRSAEHALELLETAMREGSWLGEWVHRRRDGRDITCTVLLTRTEIGGHTVIQGTVRDITLQKEQQRQLERIAHYDTLTGLPNRTLLADRMQQAMVNAKRHDSMMAIAYLDLDGFKAINDRYGHDVGDRLLVKAATRMRLALRETDTLARLGGDEFVAVLVDLTGQDDCVPMLNRLLDAAADEVTDNDYLLRVSASLGVTFYPQMQPIDADQLLRQADQAMYQAKLSGKNCYHIFDVLRDQAVRGHHENIVRMGLAIEAQEFLLHYQPKVNMRSGEVVGVEALVRWQHPQRQLLPPAEFLPVIEGHPLEITLGSWVIETALKQIEAWRKIGLDLPVSVNVSAHLLQHPDFVLTLGEMLSKRPDIPPQKLELEILESCALQDLELVTQIITDCLSLGVGFALDDFGTGYSSLTYLKRLPARTLKIDRSFVNDMLNDPEGLAMLEGVLGLARAFQRLPVAEGVESFAQGETLLDLGCELAQGFCIARPMPAADVPSWIARWRAPDVWRDR